MNAFGIVISTDRSQEYDITTGLLVMDIAWILNGSSARER